MQIGLMIFILIAGFIAGKAINNFCLPWMGYSGLPGAGAVNGIAWVLLAASREISVELFCFLAAVPGLLILSAADIQAYVIPRGTCRYLAGIGIVRLLVSGSQWPGLMTGAFCVSIPLYLIYFFSKGKAIGMGDIRLMAAAGLLLGGAGIIVAFTLSCIFGTIIHLLRMRYRGAGKKLAFGPYLSLGIWFSMVWGERLSAWYWNGLVKEW